MAYKTLFCGTPEFAVNPLRAMLSDHRFEVCGVLTQPDSRSGRGKKFKPSPVKALAMEEGVPVFTPSLAKAPDFLSQIAELQFDLAIVVAYGQILSQDFLDLFKHGCFNLHGSLLPRWRGAAPIQRAVLHGDDRTGVCLQKMVFKLDAGDVVAERTMNLDQQTGSRELYQQLSAMGAELLIKELPDFLSGLIEASPQDESQVTHAAKIDKAEAAIDWRATAREVHNKVRGLNNGPFARTVFKNKSVKILKTRVLAENREVADQLVEDSEPSKEKPGVIVYVGKQTFDVDTGDGVLEILEVQPESKSAMSAGDFIRGFKVKKGDAFATHL